MFIREFNSAPHLGHPDPCLKSGNLKDLSFTLYFKLTFYWLLEQSARGNDIHKQFDIFRLIRLNIYQSVEKSLLRMMSHSNLKLHCHTVTCEPSIFNITHMYFHFKSTKSSDFIRNFLPTKSHAIISSDLHYKYLSFALSVTLLVQGFCHVRQIRQISGE